MEGGVGILGYISITSAGAVDREFVYILGSIGSQCLPIWVKLEPDLIKLDQHWIPVATLGTEVELASLESKL